MVKELPIGTKALIGLKPYNSIKLNGDEQQENYTCAYYDNQSGNFTVLNKLYFFSKWLVNNGYSCVIAKF